MKRRVSGVLAGGAIWAAAIGSAAAADFNWKLFTIYGVADRQTELLRGFAKDVKESTGGRLEITVFSGGELPYKGVDVYRALTRRQIEIGHSVGGFIAPDLPLLDAMAMPFVCTDIRKYYASALPKTQATLDQALSDKFRVTPVIRFAMPGQQVWSRKPVKAVGDFRGMKIRTWNNGQVQTLDKLGATSVTITTAEVTPALQRGVIDGAITAAINVAAWKWSEITSHGYLWNITISDEVISANSAALKELPADVRKGFDEAAARWQQRLRDEFLKLDGEARDTLVKQGMTLVDPSPADLKALADLTADIGAAWARKNGPVAVRLLEDIREGCR